MSVPVRTHQPLLFVYEADGGDGHGVYGVTDVYEVAACRMVCALRTMPPGASASIRQARLDIMMWPYPSYRYGAVVARAWRDEDTGVLMVADADGGTGPLSSGLAGGIAVAGRAGCSMQDGEERGPLRRVAERILAGLVGDGQVMIEQSGENVNRGTGASPA